MSDLVQSLTERQKEAGEPDQLFARRLGLSRQAWQKIRTGECGLGGKALAGIVRAYPDLGGAVHSFLSSNANFVADSESGVPA